VRNTGDTRWLAGGHQGHVQVGIQLLAENRTLIALDFVRAALPRDLETDDAIEVVLDFPLPDASTPYVLKIDMVDEGVCWFHDAGSQPVYIAV
jgi:hypothetical protein